MPVSRSLLCIIRTENTHWKGKSDEKNPRIRDYSGRNGAGPLNKITDVAGVTVGHATVNTAEHKTGVTVILPCEDNPYKNKLTAAAYIHNGFGKSQGLVQMEELGTLETFIALTNTLNVGKVHDAVVDMMSEQCEREGIQVTTINPVVGECNDSGLNLIKERIIGLEEVRTAVREAKRDFEEGAVGAGTGTVCFGLKGGIGSASRQFRSEERRIRSARWCSRILEARRI